MEKENMDKLKQFIKVYINEKQKHKLVVAERVCAFLCPLTCYILSKEKR